MKFFFAFLLCFFAFSQAQLVPPGMVLTPSESVADSSDSPTAPVPFVADSASQNVVGVQERQSLNWNGPVDEDSLRYYETQVFRYGQESTHKHAVSEVLRLVAFGLGVAGLGTVGAGYVVEDEGKTDLCNFVGGGLLLGSIATMGFAFGFDVSADGLHIRAEYYKQKLIDYKRRHSILGPED